MHRSRTVVALKALFLILCSPAMLLLTGCGGSGKLTSTAQLSATPSTTTTPSNSTSPTPTPTPTPAPTPTPTPGPTPTPIPSVIPHSSHVVLVIEENHQFT